MSHANKTVLRTQLLKQRNQLSPSQILALEPNVLAKLQRHASFQQAQVVHCYQSIRSEVPTRLLTQHLLKVGKTMLVPYVDQDNQLVAACITSLEQLSPGYFGVPEPAKAFRQPWSGKDPDLVIVPGVGFDVEGKRLGYGKGFYDRFLERLNSYRLGLAWDFQRVQALPVETHDISMHEVLWISTAEA